MRLVGSAPGARAGRVHTGGRLTPETPGRRALGDGAGQAAPTAPHATPRVRPGPWSGPERFWARRPVRIALGIALAVSIVVHVGPLIDPGAWVGIEVKEIEGEAAIPVDVLSVGEPPSPPPPPPPEPPSEPAEPEPPKEKSAPPIRIARPDAGLVRDEATRDAGPDEAAAADAGDGGATQPADAAVALDPEALAASVQVGPIPIEVDVNLELIRKHPSGPTIGAVLQSLPEWDDFMGGTSIDLLRDIDWMLISGPSFIETARDSVVLRYSAPDAIVNHAVAVLARKYVRGGPFDAGVRGLPGTVVFADGSERVVLRPGGHLIVFVPPRDAAKVARQLAGARLAPHVRANEALYWRFVGPHRMLPDLPEAISEMRLRIVVRSDGGADVFAEGDCKDAEDARSAAADVSRFVRARNNLLVSLATQNLLDGVDVTAEGPLVKAHLRATQSQITAVVTLVASLLGVDTPRAPVPSGSAAPLGAPPRLR